MLSLTLHLSLFQTSILVTFGMDICIAHDDHITDTGCGEQLTRVFMAKTLAECVVKDKDRSPKLFDNFYQKFMGECKFIQLKSAYITQS